MILYIPCQIQLQLCLSFSDPIPTDPGGIFRCFQNACPCFHYLCISSLCFSSIRREGCYSAMLISCLACLISYIDLVLLIQQPIVDSNHEICFVNLGGMMTTEPAKA